MTDKAIKKSYKLLLGILLACSAIISLIGCAGAVESRADKFNKKYTLTGNQADDIVSVAMAQVDKKGSSFGYTEHWCTDFVSDCARNAGIPTSVIPQTGGVADMYNQILSCGAVRVSSPRKGDLVFYSNAEEGFTHMGIMVDDLLSVHGNVNGYGDDYTFMRTSCVTTFKYTSFRPGSPTVLRPDYSRATDWKSDEKKANPGDDFYARIVSSSTDKVLIADRKNNVVVGARKNTAEQIWHFARNDDGTYTVVNQKNGKALDVAHGSDASGANVQVYTPNKGKAQKWSLYGSQGKYILSADCTGCILDINKASAANGTNVVMSLKDKAAGQSFTVEKLSAPSKQKLKITDKGKLVVFSWEKNPNATSYVLEISKDGRVYKTVSDIKSNSTAVSLPDGDYSAVLTGVNVVLGTRSDSYKFTVNNKLSDNVKIERTTDSIRLSWDKITGARAYVVYRYESGKWKQLAKIFENDKRVVKVKKLGAGTTYKFMIRVYKKSGSVLLGKDEFYVTAATTPEAPEITSVSKSTDAVRLNWSKVKGASGYAVYKYESGEWTKVATIKNSDKLTYRISGLRSGTTYGFKLKAYKESKGETLWSDTTPMVSVTTK